MGKKKLSDVVDYCVNSLISFGADADDVSVVTSGHSFLVWFESPFAGLCDLWLDIDGSFYVDVVEKGWAVEAPNLNELIKTAKFLLTLED